MSATTKVTFPAAACDFVVQAPAMAPGVLAQLARQAGARAIVPVGFGAPAAWRFPDVARDDTLVAAARAAGCDAAFVPADRRLADVAVVAMDMDSTLITIECIDEIADVKGIRPEVAAITEAAMRGEISDYKESLRRRVALLKGVTLADMEQVYVERLQLNPGAEELVRACQAAGLKTLLVSGGFTFFTDRIRDKLKIDYTRSNVLEVRSGANCGELTGRMVDQPWGDICDGAEKRKMLLETCAGLGISPKQAIAVGDGANDLPMMGEAGLSVAYHAKPKVREQAMVQINAGGLDRLLELMA